jgi:hypothetical protein
MCGRFVSLPVRQVSVVALACCLLIVLGSDQAGSYVVAP